MFAFLLIAMFAVALGLAAQFGWAVDSRDGADWRSSEDGLRVTR